MFVVANEIESSYLPSMIYDRAFGQVVVLVALPLPLRGG